jgi:hypothetical protein
MHGMGALSAATTLSPSTASGSHGHAGADKQSQTTSDTASPRRADVQAHSAGAAMVTVAVASVLGTLDTHSGAAMLCMATLVALLLALLRWLTTARARLVVRVANRPVQTVAFSRRDRDPPSLTLLSIRRC